MEQKSLFENWLNNVPGHTNLGGFQTAMMQAYKVADGKNRTILSAAYPFWFMTPDERTAHQKAMRLFTDEETENLLVSAIEGGSNYWYYLPDTSMIEKYGDETKDPLVTMIFKAVMAGERVPVTDCNEKGYSKDGVHRLGYISLDGIMKAEQLMLKNQASHYADVKEGNDDAGTADVFLQLVVMGEITFG